jgi:hypothetical protein
MHSSGPDLDDRASARQGSADASVAEAPAAAGKPVPDSGIGEEPEPGAGEA